MSHEPVLEALAVSKVYRRPGWWRSDRNVQVLCEVSLSVRRGEFLAIVGRSGCGKTTLGRCLVGLTEPDSGEVRFCGRSLSHWRRTAPRQLLGLQMVFQSARLALNPRQSVWQAITEPLRYHFRLSGYALRQRFVQLLDMVQLSADLADRRPARLSGGQLQRVALARALAVEPQVLIADEITSNLDAPLRGKILQLLASLRDRTGMSVVYITHDLALAARYCERVVVMHDGRIVDQGEPARVLYAPVRPETWQLVQHLAALHPASWTGRCHLHSGENLLRKS